MASILPVAAFAILAAACAQTSGIELANGRTQAQTAVAPATFTDPVAGKADTEQAGRSRLTADELAIWNDPEFRRRFTESYQAETDVEPRVATIERDDIEKVAALLGEDHADDAVQLLEGARGTAASAVIDFTLGQVYAQTERFDQAIAAYEVAVTKYPKFRRAWKNLGIAHFRRAEYGPAAAELTRAIELGATDAISYGLLGYSLLNSENFVAAESAYRLAAMLDPATLEWQLGLARSMFKLQRFADAAALGASLIDAHPERADLWLVLASANLGMGQTLKAAEAFEMVDRLGKATADSLQTLADIYVNAEINGPAIDCYRRAMAMDPRVKADRPLRAANLLHARGARDAAAELLTEIERQRGDQLDEAGRKEVLHLRASIAVAEGRGDDQVAVLEQIVAMDPMDGKALILLGQHHGAKGDPQRAIYYFERAAGIEAFEAEAKRRHAQLLVKQGKYTEALPLLRRAQAIQPRDNVQDYLERIERFAQARS